MSGTIIMKCNPATAWVFGAFVLFFVAANPATAQTNTHSWIASYGNNASDCSRATPCADFAGAYDKTARGGEITCIDSGNFFPHTLVTRSLTIDCSGMVATNSSDPGHYANFYLRPPAGDTVILRGITAKFCGYEGGACILVDGPGTVIIDRSFISGARPSASGLGFGIRFEPSGSGVAKLVVTDTVIADAGGASAGAGIRIRPQGSAAASVTVEGTTISGSLFGLAVDGSNSTGGMNVSVKNSAFASNINDGIVATTSAGHAPIGVLVSGSASTNNGYGIRAIGPNVTVRVSDSDIAGNGTGLAATGGGALLSFHNNVVRANGTNGAFTGAEAVQ